FVARVEKAGDKKEFFATDVEHPAVFHHVGGWERAPQIAENPPRGCPRLGETGPQRPPRQRMDLPELAQAPEGHHPHGESPRRTKLQYVRYLRTCQVGRSTFANSWVFSVRRQKGRQKVFETDLCTPVSVPGTFSTRPTVGAGEVFPEAHADILHS